MKRLKLIATISILAICSRVYVARAFPMEKSRKLHRDITLTILTADEQSMDGMKVIIEKAKEKYGFDVKLDVVATGGQDMSRIVETRLAAGKMDDMVIYNSGALFHELDPEYYFVDLSREDALISKISEEFINAVSENGKIYGIPAASSQVGGILYRKSIYRELGLSIPNTWEEFLQNCEVLKKSGRTAIVAPYQDQWPEMVLFLADYYNVEEKIPDFAQKLTNGEKNMLYSPAIISSFQKCVDIIPFLNENYMQTTYGKATQKFADGDAAQIIMLSQILSNIDSKYGESVMNDIGIFGIPDSEVSENGITVWMPNGIFINRYSKHIDTAKEFLNFFLSEEATEAYVDNMVQDGPLCLKNTETIMNVKYPVQQEILDYFERGNICTALEFKSTVSTNASDELSRVLSGEVTAAQAARSLQEK